MSTTTPYTSRWSARRGITPLLPAPSAIERRWLYESLGEGPPPPVLFRRPDIELIVAPRRRLSAYTPLCRQAIDSGVSTTTLPVIGVRHRCRPTPLARHDRYLHWDHLSPPNVVRVILWSRDRQKLLDEVLERARPDEMTYEEPGRTRSNGLPSGYRHDHRSAPVGNREADWCRAQEAIRLWRAHSGAGLTVTPEDAPIVEGGTVVISRNLGPVLLVAPCRIMYTTATTTRFGFAYGTLPGHPEQGEEAFHVNFEDGQVLAEIVAFSRPADLPTRLAGPLARQVQKAATKRYIDGIRAYVVAK